MPPRHASRSQYRSRPVWAAVLDPSTDASPRWTASETGALLLYVAAVAFGIHQHIPGPTSPQAWMLAHEVPLVHLLTRSLHYEGTPGLWHAFLKLLQLFHASLTLMRWIVGRNCCGKHRRITCLRALPADCPPAAAVLLLPCLPGRRCRPFLHPLRYLRLHSRRHPPAARVTGQSCSPLSSV